MSDTGRTEPADPSRVSLARGRSARALGDGAQGEHRRVRAGGWHAAGLRNLGPRGRRTVGDGGARGSTRITASEVDPGLGNGASRGHQCAAAQQDRGAGGWAGRRDGHGRAGGDRSGRHDRDYLGGDTARANADRDCPGDSARCGLSTVQANRGPGGRVTGPVRYRVPGRVTRKATDWLQAADGWRLGLSAPADDHEAIRTGGRGSGPGVGERRSADRGLDDAHMARAMRQTYPGRSRRPLELRSRLRVLRGCSPPTVLT